ncbi:Negative regulator of genetic competence (MecA) [Lachnospiraceae bacterium C10]|jgi:negative regulator of genetic competence, sporulation and motility|nr:Negative regulator of genetic competence (MecA) [Lachnospiraceae bacterium C10]
MMIKRVDENSITCRISKEELEEMGLALDDLISNKEKTRDLLKEVLDEAKESVNFTADSGQLSVQVTVLPGGDISLTIFDNQKSAVAAMFRNYKDLLKDLKELDQDAGVQTADMFENFMSDEDEEEEEIEKASLSSMLDMKPNAIVPKYNAAETKERLEALEDDEPVMLPVMVSFDSLDDVIHLSKQILAWNPMAKSDLYKSDGRFYLSIVLTDHKVSMARSIFALAEYSGRVEKKASVESFIQEHGRLLRKGDAIEALAGL